MARTVRAGVGMYSEVGPKSGGSAGRRSDRAEPLASGGERFEPGRGLLRTRWKRRVSSWSRRLECAAIRCVGRFWAAYAT
jgi:hypothetical protein